MDVYDKPHTCNICTKEFANADAFKTHLRIHTGERPYKCDFCNKAFTRRDHLKDHTRIHTGEKPYQCNLCCRAFTKGGDLKRHLIVHNGEKQFQCHLCRKQFIRKSQLEKHTKTHNKSNMEWHNRINSEEELYKCNLHNNTLEKSRNLKNIAIHTGDKPYKCDFCNKAFRHSGHLRDHRRIHTGDKPYNCNLCCRAFIKECDLKRHIMVHNGEKQFQCHLCGKGFIRKSQLEKHTKTHDKSNMEWHNRIHSGEELYKGDANHNAVGKSCYLKNITIHTTDKPYKCDLCNKAFRYSGHLRDHTRIHTGEKPYKCNLCYRAFTKGGDLKRHIMVHNGEKQFQCHLCRKRFIRKSQLEKHTKTPDKSNMEWHNRIHSGEELYNLSDLNHNTVGKRCNLKNVTTHIGEKPYKCDFSDKAFTQNSHVEIHRRTESEQKLCMTGIGCCFDEKELLMREITRGLSSLSSIYPSSNENNLSGDQLTISAVINPFLLLTYGCAICDEMFQIEKEFTEHCSNHYDIPLRDTFIDLVE